MINSGCLQPPLGEASEFAVYFIIIEFNKAKSTLLSVSLFRSRNRSVYPWRLTDPVALHVVLFFPSKRRNYRMEAPNGTPDGSVDLA